MGSRAGDRCGENNVSRCSLERSHDTRTERCPACGQNPAALSLLARDLKAAEPSTVATEGVPFIDLAAKMRKQKDDEIAAAIAYAQRKCDNCGSPRDQHIEVRKGFDFNTPIGINNIQSPPLAVLCPDSVFKEPTK
jgi:predicted RNA-binding Zn-ribbon protein involved in translation (DUF1610 family)